MSGRIISGERELAQSELMARVARAAGGLAALGIGADGAVAIVLRNDFAFFEAAMAATLVGAYAVPVNWHFKSDEAGHVIRDCGARAVVIHADLWPAIRDAIPTEVALFVVATPPEIRDAYGLEPAVCRVPRGRHRLGRLAGRARALGPAAAARPHQHDLYLRHHRAAQGRAARAGQ